MENTLKQQSDCLYAALGEGKLLLNLNFEKTWKLITEREKWKARESFLYYLCLWELKKIGGKAWIEMMRGGNNIEKSSSDYF